MKKKILIISLVVVCLLCFVIFAVVAQKNCSSGTTNNGEVDESLVTVSTPYAELKVTKTFYDKTENNVTSEEPYTVEFTSKKGDDLFSVVFNEESDLLLCSFKKDGKDITAYAKMGKLDEKSPNYDEDCILQEEVNVIKENLTADYASPQKESQSGTEAAADTYDIETPIGNVKYPVMWKDKVKTEKTGNTVKFSNDGTPLFDLVFEKCDGYLLGTYKDTPVYVVYHDVKTDEQHAMVDDINFILQGLMKDKNFTVNYGNKKQ